MAKDKPIVFQGNGYQIIRGDPRNLELYVLGSNAEGKTVYQFKGYYGTIEQALASIVHNSYLTDELVAHDIESYVQSIKETKMGIIADIKNQLSVSSETEIEDDDLFN
jgi:hypothetical protein